MWLENDVTTKTYYNKYTAVLVEKSWQKYKRNFLIENY